MKIAAELVSSGSELLDGRRLNTHAQLIGAELARTGIALERDTTVPDGREAMRDAILSAMGRVKLIFVTGGLGPTSDDVTREVIADIAGARIVMDESTLQKNNEWLRKRGRKPNPSFDRHALVVEGAMVLSNSAGLSPGERIDADGTTIFLLPGPPHELRAIWAEHVDPWIREAFANELPLCRSFRFCGVGESDIAMRLERAGFSGDGLEVAYCARPGHVELRLLAHAREQHESLEKAARLVRGEFPGDIFSETDGGEVLMEQVVGDLLRERKLTLATAESCTGGLISHRITNIPGSSDYFRGGVAAYANDVKSVLLGVDDATLAEQGAVSEAGARQMAEGARRALSADVALSTTGIAGPSGGTVQKPVGLVYIAIADASGTVCREIRAAGGRDYIKTWTAQLALDSLRRRLLGLV
jgi:nicotinamide-nucleotide amidase